MVQPGMASHDIRGRPVTLTRPPRITNPRTVSASRPRRYPVSEGGVLQLVPEPPEPEARRQRITNPRTISALRPHRNPRSNGGRAARIQRLLLALILIAAIAVRFAGIDWGGSAYLHPDERFMTMVALGIEWPGSIGAYFDSATSSLNPYNNDFGSYLYGSFPLFLAKLLGTITGYVVYGDAH